MIRNDLITTSHTPALSSAVVFIIGLVLIISTGVEALL
jgi:hypothetical protein